METYYGEFYYFVEENKFKTYNLIYLIHDKIVV